MPEHLLFIPGFPGGEVPEPITGLRSLLTVTRLVTRLRGRLSINYPGVGQEGRSNQHV